MALIIIESTFETDPQTYITTIGLYNDANELIAVAKTSQPIVKSFDKEVLIKVKLSSILLIPSVKHFLIDDFDNKIFFSNIRSFTKIS